MDANISEIFTQIAREKNIGMNVVMDTLKESLVSAAKRYIGLEKNIEVKIDKDSGNISVALKVKVVEEENEENEENEILLADATEFDPDVKVGDDLVKEIPLSAFGRSIIQMTKQSIIQKVREAERDKIFEDYQDRIGELITGSVRQVDRGTILVNLGRTEAIIPLKEQIKGERYRQGDTIRAYIVDVQNQGGGAQILLSRTHPQFLAKLFELEVPEIYDRIVELKGVAREPGKRSKIAVYSKDNRIDPVGACVGMKGNRVQAIVRELNNERIDIINWTDEVDVFLRRVFNPIELKKLHFVGKTKVVVIVVDTDLSQSIGKGGQNIRLSSQLVGRELEIYGIEQWAELSEQEKNKILTSEPVIKGEGEQEPSEETADSTKE
jgi:N utilization substance protein A